MSKAMMAKSNAESVKLRTLVDSIKLASQKQMEAQEEAVLKEIDALKLSQTQACNATESRLQLALQTQEENIRIRFNSLETAHKNHCIAFDAFKVREASRHHVSPAPQAAHPPEPLRCPPS